MRFLHTSDWHVGKGIRIQKRDSEYRDALAQVLDVARRERVDCLLVAGDVFETSLPPPEAERIVFDFFRELAGAGIPAVVVAGNHDHPRRLNAFGQILGLVNIHVVGEPVTPEEGGIIEMTSRDGSETAVIVALPWVSERKVRDFESLLIEGKHFEEYSEGVSSMLAHLCKEFRSDTINLAVSHIMVDGALIGEGGGERPLHLGQTYAIPPTRLPDTAQYIALGHVHRPQPIIPNRALFSGSIIQLDFGEAGQDKSVVIVDAAPGRPAHIELVPITAGRRLRDIGSPGAGLTIEELQQNAGDTGDDYLRVFVKVDRPRPGLAEIVREALPNAVAINLESQQSEPDRVHEDLMRLRPDELFTAYYRDQHLSEPSRALMDLFHELHEQVTDETD